MKAKYNSLSNSYDYSRKADDNIYKTIKNNLDLENNKKYIDIGCGTGNYTIKFFNDNIDVTGLDISEKMLKIAKNKNDKINWINAKAEKIPFNNNAFDGGICVLAIHHFKSLKKAFTEISRVIKKGKFIIFTALPEQMKYYWLNEYFPKIMKRSINQMPDYNKIKINLEKSGFKIKDVIKYEITNDIKDLFLYSGKNNPELYLNDNIRQNVSSLSLLSNKKKIEKEMKKLENDIKSKKITDIQSKYKDDKGDYIFIIAEK